MKFTATDKGIHQFFEEQVMQAPAATAIVFEGQSLTYSELNSRANQLAHHLIKSGIKKETLVAICLERSVEMIVGLLGILKAGAAYLPLDPAYPQARLEMMLQDSGAELVITQEKFLELISPNDTPALCIDRDWDTVTRESDHNPEVGSFGDTLAYVIYTSGSTGKPKGVLVTHWNVVRLFAATEELFSFNERDTWSLFHSFAFDFSVWEIWGALVYGGRLVVVPHWISRSPEAFHKLLLEEEVTVLNQTPSAFLQLIQADARSNKLLPLRYVIFGGEALDFQRLGAWFAKYSANTPRLVNMYGITETTVHVTYQLITPDQAANNSGSVIGRPLLDLQVYILDRQLKQIDDGTTGEMYVGGAGVSRGYLGRPALTAERFVCDPFSDTPGARLYQTGDLARLLPDGTLEYMGRVDEQVKIRGFRVELGEIQSTLEQHPKIRECLVVPSDDGWGSQRLVAYVVPQTHEKSGAPELEAEQISQWTAVWDETYRQQLGQADPTFNTSGWNNSYTGKQYSADEVREWVEHTVSRILALKPRRVLEVGCGTGLLLFRIAPYCERYVGTDPTASALRNIQFELSQPEKALPQVELLQRMGDDFSGIDPESFDLVVLNSVAHHFPSLDYMIHFLERAVASVRPGGAVFIGDIRNFALLEAFHASVQLYRSDASSTTSELQERIGRHVFAEDQLLIDPRFFRALKRHLPRITDVEIKLKRGRYRDEITCFRYDAVLHVDSENEKREAHWLDWQKQELTVPRVKEVLAELKYEILGLKRVPNARVREGLKLLRMLSADKVKEPLLVSEIRTTLLEGDPGLEPEDFWELNNGLPYEVDVTWCDSGGDGSFDVLLRRFGASPASSCMTGDEADPDVPLSVYANNPLRSKLTTTLVPKIRSFLKNKLPDYMVPSAFVVIDEIPLTPNGKVNRKALPLPDQVRPESERNFVAPRTPTEEMLCGIWASVLKLDRIGIYDNFFEFGGHSLVATQVISRIRDAFNVDLPLRLLFETPTPAALAKEVETARFETQLGRLPLLPVARKQDSPLSYAQQRLWFLQQLHRDSSFYNTIEAIQISGSLNLDSLRQTFSEIISRHESLRTRFVEVSGRPVQVVDPPAELTLPITDFSRLPTDERKQAALRFASERSQEPFNLATGPLIRLDLMRLSDTEHILTLNLHHIITDGWSTVVFFREFAALYEAFSEGKPSPLEPLPVQYPDFAVWQRQWFDSGVLEQQLAYWKQQLAAAPPFLQLPTDRARPKLPTFRGSEQSVVLPKQLSSSLLELSQQEGVTLYMTLLAAFQALLSRYTGQEDIVVGSPIAARNRAEIEGLIGFFVNTLALRTNLSGNPTFRELLRRVREVALGAYANQDVPFERLVEELHPDRDLSRNPIFQVMLAPYDAPLHELELSGLKLRLLDVESVSTKFDLTLFVVESADGLRLRLEYNTDLFDPETISRFFSHYQNILTSVVADAEQRLATLPLMSKGETQRLLVEWNDTAEEFSPFTSVSDYFERQVVAAPHSLALVCCNQEFTYEQLNARANHVAHFLRRYGVGANSPVGLCLDRSPELMIGLLGILKAGGAYVPLNPDHPPARLLLQLHESRCQILLTEAGLATALSEFSGKTVLLDGNTVLREEALTNPPRVASPDDLAYVIYTSGSTGVPKAVGVTQGNLTNYAEFMRRRVKADATANRLSFATVTTLSADLGNTCIFPAWITGGCVHVLSYEASTDPHVFSEYVRRHPIDVLKIVPSHLESLIASADGKAILPAKFLVLGGEALSWDLVERINLLSPPCEVINHYGPTETTIGSLTFSLTTRPNGSPATVPIGRPIANTQIFNLDAHLNPAPTGVVGELYIAGDGVARGYLNSARETAERFLPNPFASAGSRMYRTGDRVRYLPDGNLEFMGRVDDQLKIRGYRIEIGEVELVMRGHPAVEQVVVVAREGSTGDKALVAYVVAVNGSLDAGGLRDFLLSRLPDYMIPAAFVFLDALPLTPNGKVDRKALPAPTKPLGQHHGLPAAPRTKEEQIVAGIWADILNLEQVDINDNFFTLGGHSLMVIQVISRIREALKLELPVRSMFEAPTVAEFCQLIVKAQSGLVPTPESRIARVSRRAYRVEAPAPSDVDEVSVADE